VEPERPAVPLCRLCSLGWLPGGDAMTAAELSALVRDLRRIYVAGSSHPTLEHLWLERAADAIESLKATLDRMATVQPRWAYPSRMDSNDWRVYDADEMDMARK